MKTAIKTESGSTKEVAQVVPASNGHAPLTQAFDMTQPLPNLHKEAREIPIDLSSTYWTPEVEGESRRGFYQRIESSTYVNEKSGEAIELPCVIFIAQNANGEITTIRNGSKRLVASIDEAVQDGRISPGMPLIITYLGKVKNKTNSYFSDRWSVKPLIVNQK